MGGVDAIILFEDMPERFLPLTYTKPIYALWCGGYPLWVRIKKKFRSVAMLMREYLARFWSEETGLPTNNLEGKYDSALFISGRAYLADEKLLGKALSKDGVALYDESGLVMMRTSSKKLDDVLSIAIENPLKVAEALSKVAEEKMVLNARCTISYIWDLITANADLAKERIEGGVKTSLPGDVKVIGPEKAVSLLGDVEFEGPAVLDTRSGPIVLEGGVTIGPFTVIKGPAWIGRDSRLFAARLEAVTIGEACKIAGEMKHSIVESRSNKAHEGYIGRSYIGQWVNIGAYTVTSDLKNTYGTVRVGVGAQRVDTGLQKLGVFIADYVKTSVGTMIFAGRRIGTCSHVFDRVTEDVPSFTIYAPTSLRRKVEIPPEKAILIQERVLARRGVKMKESERELIRRVFEITVAERRRAGVVKGSVTP